MAGFNPIIYGRFWVITEEFTLNGLRLPDPSPTLSVEQVRETYAVTYPEIATASLEGPETVGNKLVYRFSRAIGSKG